jgi:hypothetical protein
MVIYSARIVVSIARDVLSMRMKRIVDTLRAKVLGVVIALIIIPFGVSVVRICTLRIYLVIT